MTNFVDINKEFIEKTITLLTDLENRTNKEVTLLINCCLGLIGVPSEKQREEPEYEVLFKKKLTDLYKEHDKWGIKRDFIKLPKHNRITLGDLTRKIRNGICHLHIHTTPDDKDQIKTLIIKDKLPHVEDFNFEIELPVANLRKFALALANEILNIEKAKY